MELIVGLKLRHVDHNFLLYQIGIISKLSIEPFMDQSITIFDSLLRILHQHLF